MTECEFIEKCPFFNDALDTKPDTVEEMKVKYCKSNNLNCARYMIATAVGKEYIPDDLYPDQKMQAYAVIAENS